MTRTRFKYEQSGYNLDNYDTWSQSILLDWYAWTGYKWFFLELPDEYKTKMHLCYIARDHEDMLNTMYEDYFYYEYAS